MLSRVLRLAPGAAGPKRAGAPRCWWRGTLPDGRQAGCAGAARFLKQALARPNYGPQEDRKMKKQIPGISAVALGLLLGAGGVAPAQDKQHTETTTKQTGPGPDAKTKSEWVIGTVKDYEAGKKIKIEGPGGKDYSFDLDEVARVQGTIVVGQKARVGYSKSADGVERVTVLSAASADAQAATSAPRAHTEMVTKESGPGPDAKTKSEVVIGTVKDYEPGKKIKVTGPGDKDFSFDLDEGVTVHSNVTVGERVKVTYTKLPNGNKATTIEPDRGMK